MCLLVQARYSNTRVMRSSAPRHSGQRGAELACSCLAHATHMHLCPHGTTTTVFSLSKQMAHRIASAASSANTARARASCFFRAAAEVLCQSTPFVFRHHARAAAVVTVCIARESGGGCRSCQILVQSWNQLCSPAQCCSRCLGRCVCRAENNRIAGLVK